MSAHTLWIRLALGAGFLAAIAWSQRATERPERSARLHLVVKSADTGEITPARVKHGAVMLTNGPLLDLTFEDGSEPGAAVEWAGGTRTIRGKARASWHRPVETVELVVNGNVVARRQAEGGAETVELSFQTSIAGSAWIAARAQAPSLPGEPAIGAHANPAYFLHHGAPPYQPEARRALAERWKAEAQYYRESPLVFSAPERRRELLDRVAATEAMLAAPPKPWRRN